MDSGQEFVDYYALLQVNPTCDAKMLEKAYRYSAQMYHPDHTDTADVDKFQEIIAAYSVLRTPEKRAEYDRVYREHNKGAFFAFPANEAAQINEESAIEDAEAHEKILFHLYKQRRENATDPGVMGYYLQRMLDCSDENFEFHAWYLKSKGYIEITQEGKLAITIDGVDHVISMSRTAEAEKLLIAQAKTGTDEAA